MSEPIREQISAFLDGELPSSETELLLKRLARDADLRESFGRYALIGEAMRLDERSRITRGFAARINATIDGEPAVSNAPPAVRARAAHWWRPIAGAAVAASVAVVAVVALQQRTVAPTANSLIPRPAALSSAPAVRLASQPAESSKPYVVPATVAAGGAGEAGAASGGRVLAASGGARLTNYIFAHSRYSSPLGQSNVLSELLADPDETAAAGPRPVSSGAVVNDAALRQPVLKDARSSQ
jgi:sigma-E factor negative regulatory protein RseA